MLGAVCIKKNEIDQGISFLEKAIDIDKKDTQSLYNLAGAYAIKRKFENIK